MINVGIIGAGDMGKLYARSLAKHEDLKVSVTDVPGNIGKLRETFKEERVKVISDAYEVAGKSDFVIYSVPVEEIIAATKEYAGCTREGATILGASSVKSPEFTAFRDFMPRYVGLTGFHSLHGPSISPVGQTIATVNYRSHGASYQRSKDLLQRLGSKIVELKDAREHDKITADTQVATHLGFESMGTAWMNAGVYPWENGAYSEGIDNVKTLMALRLFGGKPHVYSGLAFFNPFALEQVGQYSNSVSELFGLMIGEKEEEFRGRIGEAREAIFNNGNTSLRLPDDLMREHSLNKIVETGKPNSHLSLLAMMDSWARLGINPYTNLVCETPLFRLRLGIVEYLAKNDELYESAIKAALYDKSIRNDDLRFVHAVNEWSRIIQRGDREAYNSLFTRTQSFFKDKIPAAKETSDKLIARLAGLN